MKAAPCGNCGRRFEPGHDCPEGRKDRAIFEAGRKSTMSWADEYLAASQVTDMAKDPDDFRVSRQSKVTIGGLLVPVSEDDTALLEILFTDYQVAFQHFRQAVPFYLHNLTATMRRLIEQAANRADDTPDFNYISIDPRDYTIFTAPHVDVPVVCIHTRPERCWFLGILRFEGALGLSLGRLRVMRPNDKGMYPVTIRTKWRALTNKVKQEEVRDAYQRLIQGATKDDGGDL